MTTTLRLLGFLIGLSLLIGPLARAEVTAWLRVARTANDAEGRPTFDAEEFRTLKATAVELASTRVVLGTALEAEGVADLAVVKGQVNPAAWLAERLTVRSQPESELIELRLDAEGEQAALVLDAVAKALLTQLNGPATGTLSDGLQALLDAAEGDLEQQNKQYTALCQSLHALDRETAQIRRTLLHDQLSGHARAMLDAKANFEKLEGQVADEERMRAAVREKTLTDGDLESYLRQHPHIGVKFQLRDRLAQELQTATANPAADDGEVRQLQLRLQQADDELRRAKDEHRAVIEKRIREGTLAPLGLIHGRSRQAALESYRQAHDEAAAECERLRGEIAAIAEHEHELEALADGVQRHKARVVELRRLAVAAEAAIAAPRVTLLQAAAPPLR